MFCARYDYTPNELQEARLREITSTDPIDWGVIRDQVTLMMADMFKANYYDEFDPWPAEALAMFKDVRAMEPETCKDVAKSVVHFFETFGERMELRIKAKDMPQGDSVGASPIPIEELEEMTKHGGREQPHKNVAMEMHLKEWGPRVCDLGILTVGDYWQAKNNAVYNDLGEPFISIKPARTIKEGIMCNPHLGPEGIEATDRYLAVERPDARADEPLFMKWSKTYDRRGPVSGASVSQAMKKMIWRACGKERAEQNRWTPHSIRKTWENMIISGGMPESWAKVIQGKARDTYKRPKDLQGPDGDTLLMEAYIKAYDRIRLFRESQELRQRVKEIEQEKVQDNQRLNYLEMRMSLYDSIIEDLPMIREYLDEQKKQREA